jgi:hypothetical protein
VDYQKQGGIWAENDNKKGVSPKRLTPLFYWCRRRESNSHPRKEDWILSLNQAKFKINNFCLLSDCIGFFVFKTLGNVGVFSEKMRHGGTI